MRVAIAGGGIGGLTLALALARRGTRATLIEREPVWGEVGAGVQLGPNAVRVLDGLGLGEALRACAWSPDAAEVFSAHDGALRLRVPLGAQALARWGAPYLQLRRTDLQRMLLGALDGGLADLRRGSEVESATTEGRLRLASGETLEAEVVVGADGLRSRVRATVAIASSPRFAGQAAWRALIPVRALPPHAVPTGAAVWAGSGRHVVAYRVEGGRAVNLVAIAPSRNETSSSWRTTGDARELARAFDAWPPAVRDLAAAPAALGLEIGRWPLFDRPPPRALRRGRVVLLGDAAHPMLPFLAQGAAMAIEDAAVLAGLLTATADAASALDAYAAARLPRVARVQRWSRRNARLFHLPEPAAAAVFAAARRLDARDPSHGMARFDWLYGWRP